VKREKLVAGGVSKKEKVRSELMNEIPLFMGLLVGRASLL